MASASPRPRSRGCTSCSSPTTRPISPAFSRPFEGVPELLDALREAGRAAGRLHQQVRGAVASRCWSQLGLAERFGAIAGRDTFAVCKPDPGHLTRHHRAGRRQRRAGGDGRRQRGRCRHRDRRARCRASASASAIRRGRCASWAPTSSSITTASSCRRCRRCWPALRLIHRLHVLDLAICGRAVHCARRSTSMETHPPSWTRF